MIDNGNTFYTKDVFGNQIVVKTFTTNNGRFIKTAANNKWTDNLDNLPRSSGCGQIVWR